LIPDSEQLGMVLPWCKEYFCHLAPWIFQLRSIRNSLSRESRSIVCTAVSDRRDFYIGELFFLPTVPESVSMYIYSPSTVSGQSTRGEQLLWQLRIMQ
jgi:hypothetical protein